MILGLKQILDYSVNIQIFGYSIMILNIQIIISKEICDWACENRAYLHIKIDMFFELQLAITSKLIQLFHWSVYAALINQLESR